MDEFFKQQRIMHELCASIMPDESVLSSFREQAELIKAVSLHKELIDQVTMLNAKIPETEILSLTELCASTNAILPDYPEGYTEALNFLDVYKNAQIFIPEELQSFNYDNNCMIEVTEALVNENTQLIQDVMKWASTSKDFSSCLTEPLFSTSTHLHIAQSIGYFNIGVDEQTESRYLDIVETRSSSAEDKINEKNKDWLQLLHGAKHSLCSRNPDRVRHAITSLRELITQILHTQAPNEEVKKRYTDPVYYHEGNPTRRARISCILESKNSGLCLLGCLEKDVSALLELFELFHQGTHEVISRLDEQELEFIVKRTELVIEQLL